MSSKRKYGAPSRSSYSRKSKRTRYTAMSQKANIPAVLRSRQGELKTLDVALTATSIDSTGSVNLLNGIQEGSGFYNRIGRKVSMKSVRLTGLLSYIAGSPAAAAVGFEYGRVLILYDRQPNGAAPAVSDVLAQVDNAGASSTSAFSGINMNNADRFQILRDKRLVVPGRQDGATVGYTAPVYDAMLQGISERTFNLDFYVPLKSMVTHYKSTSNPAVIGDISTGSLLCLVLGINTAANAIFKITWTSRLRFNDA